MAVQCTDAEWKIMEVLWDSAPRTMKDITKALELTTGWTRHTVITLLKRMEQKGSVAVDDSGAVKRYTPRVTRAEASTQQTRNLLSRVFSGNATLLVNNLMDAGELDIEDIEKLLADLHRGTP